MTSIAFLYDSRMPPFIEKDFNFLSMKYDIIDIPYRGLNDIPNMVSSVRKADISYSWFAGEHAAIAIATRKPSIVILGGFEVARCPDIRYGAALRRRSAFMAKIALKYASNVLAVDESLIQEARDAYRLDCRNMEVLPTGYDSDYFRPGPKEDIVLTVSPESAYLRKGIPAFLAAASHFPNIRFVVVGSGHKRGYNNITFTGHVSDKELLAWYKKAKIYCQLSVHEGLPNALCEAMLCECVPIGTRANGIPKAIGETGFLVSDFLDLVKGIRFALKSDGAAARDRIKSMFPEKARQDGLCNLVDSIMSS